MDWFGLFIRGFQNAGYYFGLDVIERNVKRACAEYLTGNEFLKFLLFWGLRQYPNMRGTSETSAYTVEGGRVELLVTK